MNSFTYLLARKQRCLQGNKPYHLMNNMKFSKIIPDFDSEEFANLHNFKLENDIYNNGANIFYDENELVVAVFDYVNQMLFTDSEDLL